MQPLLDQLLAGAHEAPMIGGRLHAPDDAKFAGIFSMPGRPVTTGITTRWRSWVKAKNLFGVTLHRWYVCSHNAKTDMVTVKMEGS
jgi:hypothetical protein